MFLFDGSVFVASSEGKCFVASRLVKYFSKVLPLSLLDPRVFGQVTDSRGTESRGIDLKNFWSRV